MVRLLSKLGRRRADGPGRRIGWQSFNPEADRDDEDKEIL